MRIVITGGAGFIGRQLAARLLKEPFLTSRNGERKPLEKLVLFDAIEAPPELANDERVEAIVGDIGNAAAVRALIDDEVDSVYHLAAVVSAGAEADFDLGWLVNLDGMRLVLEAARRTEGTPRVIFTSSIAVYGAMMPDVVVDETPLIPQTSYGAQKAVGEQLIHDYSRKGYIDGRAVRLPTISVRPGKPNKAASGFASGIFREPLIGIDHACPVAPESCMALMSPRKVIDSLVGIHEVAAADLGDSRSLLLPGLRVSMGEAKAAVERVGAGRDLGKITFEPDPAVQKIVDYWPRETYSARAEKLGFVGDDNVDDIIRAHIEDELSDG
ncbi:MAG: SDR family oxidoreductase [Alphaproteobacteria bacterium]